MFEIVPPKVAFVEKLVKKLIKENLLRKSKSLVGYWQSRKKMWDRKLSCNKSNSTNFKNKNLNSYKQSGNSR